MVPDGRSFRLTRTGADWGDTDVDALRRTFQRQHCVKLEGLVEPALLRHIHRLLGAADFSEFEHPDIASELLMSSGTCLGLLYFLSNDPSLFRFVEAISDCPPLRAFIGRVYRRCPNTNHHDSWHGDNVDDRVVGMSINLSTDTYEGGTFEIREAGSASTIAALPNVGLGDAILFRIGPTLEHQVTALRGAHAKTAFAGWFLGGQPEPAGAAS